MKSKKLIPVKVYFSDEKIVKRLEHVSSVTGFSLSGVSAMAIRLGIAQVEEALLKVNRLPDNLVPSGVQKQKAK